MDALTALHTRVSTPRLGGEPPDEKELENLFKAALRAPDHALLRPWRFLLVRGESRKRLGELFADAQLADDDATSEAALEKTRNKPLRAPLIIVVIACIQPHPKVPDVEQLISAGAAAHAMLIAAHAQGIGAMWRTGGMAYHPYVMQGLGLAASERIVGYLYVGRVEGKVRELVPLPVEEFVTEWTA